MTNRKSCIALLFLAASISAPAQLTTLASFNKANGRDPGYPAAPFAQGVNGNFFGTTIAGSASDEGTVFEMTPAGKLFKLYSFCSQPGCSDGAVANAGLIQATDGNLYGTTADGGTNNLGTVFQITPGGKLNTIYRFCSVSGCSDGANPEAGLVQAADGNLYGTTCCGGAFGAGTVFRIDKSGGLTTLASFDGTNGNQPGFGSLIQGSDGSLYGTTTMGGINFGCRNSEGCGTIFRVTLGGQLNSIYSFCELADCTDGAAPFGGLVQGADGNLYGTTTSGGTFTFGTIFKLTGPGALTTLHSFDSSDGAFPEAGLTLGTDGNFYGTTPNGGSNGFSGTIFSITPAGQLTTLYSFCSKADCADGTGPFSGVIQATNGQFYGATFAGGTSANCSGGCGTTFSLSVGLGPFIETRLSAGKAGSRVAILGNDLTGATGVSFNGTAADFTVVSDTEIVATVPTAASTGPVTVATLSGSTLTSNQPFRVTQ